MNYLLLKFRVFSKGSGDIFIWRMIDRNRAIHGDEVVVEMYPEAQWKSRCMTLNENPYEGGLYYLFIFNNTLPILCQQKEREHYITNHTKFYFLKLKRHE